MNTPKRPPRKAGNPPESPWRSTPDELRERPRVGPFTISRAALVELERQADKKHDGNKSAAIEAAIWRGALPERQPLDKP